MRISLNWLKRYVDVTVSAQELGRALTMVGFPVPSIEQAGDDFVLDVEVTSNRPDLLSHLGVAREIAGLLGVAWRQPESAIATRGADEIEVEVTEWDLCPRYAARVVRGVQVGASPNWLVKLLEAVGQRSVNNVVDVTNFVMLECGQPLHAFDLAKLRGPKIVVRRAEGESMTAIDGTRLVVGRDELAICDAERPIALAGVMGGLETEVSTSTRDVVLESAIFSPLAIRAASRAHQIRSEAAFRFERFVDPAGADWASNRAELLLFEVCGATSSGPMRSREAPHRSSVSPRTPTVRTERVARVLGVDVPENEIRTTLRALGFECREDSAPGTTTCIVPSWRPDVADEIDLIEEVARRIGFDRVPLEVRIPVRPAMRDEDRRTLRRLRDSLVAAGLRECCTAPFVGEGPHDIALLFDVPALRLENPMRSEENLLRRSLLGPLLTVARGNHDRGVPEVRLFEMAPVYVRGAAAGEDREPLLASGVVSGSYADAKGCVDAVLHALRLGGRASFTRGAGAPLSDRAALVRIGGDVVGAVGEIAARALARHGLERPTAVFELRADLLARMAPADATYEPVPRYPCVERDLAWVVDESVDWATLASAVRSGAGDLLSAVRPFDVFRSPQIGPGRKSIALRMELRSGDRTLTGAEADACVARVIESLRSATGGTLRS